MQDLEEHFGKYIDNRDAEQLFNMFFTAIRKAYIAGYKAALNKKSAEGRLIHLVYCEGEDNAKSAH